MIGTSYCPLHYVTHTLRRILLRNCLNARLKKKQNYKTEVSYGSDFNQTILK